ncbi:hypothetical protein B9G53_19345 [Pseudanabaena sp. SR411]|uniref:hypothetical protein n=1 Tax=Pseudanabaena sp. SR411 TaxID=1980935 RepID=UPI000B98A52B|nr:hypothetical protein [Pseudanabaena sp. SR411]OYQ62982.1 hypothetical protein B9G53_19345 [Pseudanabaena sp. SR411]
MTEETPTSQVPLLDLAPKLKRPLSLRNPLDYLLLLYWVFYFPQAIRWYVETFCEPLFGSNRLTWKLWWELTKNRRNNFQLTLMGIILEISIPTLIHFSLQSFGFDINWVRLVLCLSIGVSITVNWNLGIPFAIAVGMMFSLTFAIAFDIMNGLLIIMAFGMVLGVGIRLLETAVTSTLRALVRVIAEGLAVFMTIGVVIIFLELHRS